MSFVNNEWDVSAAYFAKLHVDQAKRGVAWLASFGSTLVTGRIAFYVEDSSFFQKCICVPVAIGSGLYFVYSSCCQKNSTAEIHDRTNRLMKNLSESELNTFKDYVFRKIVWLENIPKDLMASDFKTQRV